MGGMGILWDSVGPAAEADGGERSFGFTFSMLSSAGGAFGTMASMMTPRATR